MENHKVSKSWENVVGKCELILEGDSIPKSLKDILPGEYYEVSIEFKSSGWMEEGVYDGPFEDCYPDEGEEEREPVSGYVIDETGVSKDLDQTSLDRIFNTFPNKIYDAPIDV